MKILTQEIIHVYSSTLTIIHLKVLYCTSVIPLLFAAVLFQLSGACLVKITHLSV